MDLTSNDWKHLKLKLLKRKISLKTLYPYRSKVEDFQKLSNKEIYFILQSNSIKWYKRFDG